MTTEATPRRSRFKADSREPAPWSFYSCSRNKHREKKSQDMWLFLLFSSDAATTRALQRLNKLPRLIGNFTRWNGHHDAGRSRTIGFTLISLIPTARH